MSFFKNTFSFDGAVIILISTIFISYAYLDFAGYRKYLVYPSQFFDSLGFIFSYYSLNPNAGRISCFIYTTILDNYKAFLYPVIYEGEVLGSYKGVIVGRLITYFLVTLVAIAIEKKTLLKLMNRPDFRSLVCHFWSATGTGGVFYLYKQIIASRNEQFFKDNFFLEFYVACGVASFIGPLFKCTEFVLRTKFRRFPWHVDFQGSYIYWSVGSLATILFLNDDEQVRQGINIAFSIYGLYDALHYNKKTEYSDPAYEYRKKEKEEIKKNQKENELFINKTDKPESSSSSSESEEENTGYVMEGGVMKKEEKPKKQKKKKVSTAAEQTPDIADNSEQTLAEKKNN